MLFVIQFSCQKAATTLNQCSLISSDRSNKWIVANGEELKNMWERPVCVQIIKIISLHICIKQSTPHSQISHFVNLLFGYFVLFFSSFYERQLRRWWWWLFSVVVVAVYFLSIKNYGQKLAELSYWFLMKVRTLNCCLMTRTWIKFGHKLSSIIT